jgi:hypothetical protein
MNYYILAILLTAMACKKPEPKGGQLVDPAVDQGGKETGGGEIADHRQNPWFIQNTKTITYCVIHDASHFGAGEDKATSAITAAFNFWKDQFVPLNADKDDGSLVRLGTQEITRTTCQDSTDVTFYLGTLPANLQKLLIKEPAKVVGNAVMTQYDKVELKGRGFVYISPETGPLALDLANKAPNRWTVNNGESLKAVLRHEIGHIFLGPKHLESGLMAAGAPEMAATLAGELSGPVLPEGFSFRQTEPMTYVTRNFQLPAVTKSFGISNEAELLVVKVKLRDKEPLEILERSPTTNKSVLLRKGDWKASALVTNGDFGELRNTKEQTILRPTMDGDAIDLSSYNPVTNSFPIYAKGNATGDFEYVLSGADSVKYIVKLSFAPREMKLTLLSESREEIITLELDRDVLSDL